MILVTGATGTNGTEILKRLATGDVQVRAMVRNRERASGIALPYVEVVEGDFDRLRRFLPHSLEWNVRFCLPIHPSAQKHNRSHSSMRRGRAASPT